MVKTASGMGNPSVKPEGGDAGGVRETKVGSQIEKTSLPGARRSEGRPESIGEDGLGPGVSW